MDLSSWVLVGTTLFLGAIAIFAPFLSELIKRKYFSPEATIIFDTVAPYCHKTYYRGPIATGLDLPPYSEPVFFFRFFVKNTGKSKIVDCEAVLEELWIFNSAGIPKKLHGFNDVTLAWAGSQKTNLSISPNRGKYCNIGHIASASHQLSKEKDTQIDLPGNHEKDLRFRFELLEIPNSQPNCLPAGKYAIKISLYSENAPTQELWFEIAWSGNWQDEELHMFRELTVRRIPKIS